MNLVGRLISCFSHPGRKGYSPLWSLAEGRRSARHQGIRPGGQSPGADLRACEPRRDGRGAQTDRKPDQQNRNEGRPRTLNHCEKGILMYHIEKRPSGYILTFSGDIGEAEMRRWKDDSERTLAAETAPSFGVIIDMRSLLPLKREVQAIMVEGQRLYRNKGMERSAVILSSADICRQFRNLAVQSGIFATERYIDASHEANPIDRAVNWVKSGIDPDKQS